MANVDVTQTLEALNALATAPPSDPEVRKQLYNAAQKLGLAVEAPYDTVYRIIYSPILLTVAQIAGNMRIFKTLVEKDTPLNSVDLAAAAGADVTLTGRIARYLASHGMINEVDEDSFAANHITQTLSIEGFRAGIKHYMHGTMPSLQAAPEFLEETQYANPSDMLHTPFQRGFRTDLPRFVWFQSQPDLSANFGVWMGAQHDRKMTWLDVIDFRELAHGSTPETPVFVDVGGGIGHQCALLRSRYPDLVGRVILQDSTTVVARALQTTGVEKTAHDFWTPQPVHAARAYYLRYIMHDYPDEKCLVILRNIKAAMAPDSVLLIDDMIIPNKGAHPNATDRDIAMMVNFAAMERTEKQWRALFAAAGLKLRRVATYNQTSGESVQVVGIEGH
ncbi:hypothetical protein ASPZODRAFT_153470 [Penicilliopsis zonata CBS 506.65]|uniref:O-methyltransferase C-terminal domain-containing protein n=1 Tax=Penicilliopsis zonata CBS 506.65 TaxID=1073090 RepID=A0A1L9SBH6_9EURO|nr:hypothetical protein ASPZODRAFT_153470 [Penicilliopsis zonata CBS 506.65]OJJ44533.1 hypothetical protein ASPZODRAFT_153470 [Penicilliopsis zonata CBS 506.65]